MLLASVLAEGMPFEDFEVARAFPAIGQRVMLLNARRLYREDGRGEMILLAIEDITGATRATLALAASEVRFRRLFEAAKDGILILDAESGSIVDANPYLLDLLGYSHEDLLGRKLWEIGLLGDIEASKASFRELQEKGYVRYEDLPLETSDRRHVEVEVVSNVYRSGETMIIQCNIRDVTERKRAEEALRHAKEAAEEAGRIKDRFLANLSHELRTPLTPVLATIAVLEKATDLPDALRVELATIRRNVELEAHLIDDLLDVTRIDHGKIELHLEVINAHATLREALEVCQPEAEAKGLEVSIALRAKAHTIWADPVRLQQVFWNLIKNAIKFTPDGGWVGVRTADRGGSAGDRGRRLGDRDRAGRPPPDLRRVRAGRNARHQALRRPRPRPLDRQDADRAPGRDAHRDQRWPRHGVNLPRRAVGDPPEGGQGPAAAVRCRWASSPPAGRGQRRHPAGDLRAPRSSGFAVRTAGTVIEALEAMAVETFDLLVSDIDLPDGSGLEIMRHGRDQLGLKGIAFSGYGTPDDVKESFDAGFAHHLTKPASIDTLVTMIRLTAC